MSPLFDLEAANLKEWDDPTTAAQASYESTIRLQAMLIATRLSLQNELSEEQDRSLRRAIERDLDDCYKTAVMVASKLNAERAQQ